MVTTDADAHPVLIAEAKACPAVSSAAWPSLISVRPPPFAHIEANCIGLHAVVVQNCALVQLVSQLPQ